MGDGYGDAYILYTLDGGKGWSYLTIKRGIQKHAGAGSSGKETSQREIAGSRKEIAGLDLRNAYLMLIIMLIIILTTSCNAKESLLHL